MPIQQTSIDSYNSLIKDCRIQPEELRVVEVLDLYGPMTDIEIQEKTGMKINQVTGRRCGLAKKGIVVISGTKTNPYTRKANIVWRLWNKLF